MATDIVTASALIGLGIMFLGINIKKETFELPLLYNIKYLFLFMGLYLLVNTLALSRTIAVTDNATTNTTKAVGTSIVIMEWGVLYPAFAFFTLSFLYFIFNELAAFREKKRWENG